ncbi:AMP-binding enzyme family protein [Histomonas meleagridis]|uniref:AMP-binding enzyme family protein n=1 Tax=Histomonas meleagridis TaxID=135588 RepID=UPI0035596C88|nr:AMP-binding enzyme family protein [Histomonas meleagridis]KAH0802078.1 AMP-binding enzyme family protein [Histomonas meleagridis]
MGSQQSMSRITEWLPPEKEGESPIYINSLCIKENAGQPITTFRNQPEARTLTQMIDAVDVKFGKLDGFAEREILPDGSFGEYKYITYGQFRKNCLNMASGLVALGFQKGDTIGIYSYSCLLWQTIFFACQYAGCIPVPVYDSLGPTAAEYIINHSECKAIFAMEAKLQSAIEASKNSTVKEIFIIPKAHPESPREYRTALQVMEIGAENIQNFTPNQPHPDDPCIYMYTSGSTGNPKGCILTQKGVIAGGVGLSNVNGSITKKDTYFSFLPLAHVYELCVEIVMINQGVKIGFYTGDTRRLVDDIQALQPTIMCGVPRIWNRLYQSFTDGINALPWLLRKVVTWAINNKNESLMNDREPSLLLDFLFSKFRSVLGGKLKLIVSGGAPILPDVFGLMRSVISKNVIQGYGLTEISAGGCVQETGSKNPGDVGVVCSSIQMKLRSVKDFDYNPLGNPPTGEILFRGISLFSGYYKDEELTSQAMCDGWFATGDVGMITEDGHLQIIDRVKQLVKLSQGEYISMTSLTEQYQNTPGIESIYIYADSHHNTLVAIVVPTQDKIKEWEKSGINDFMDNNMAKKDMLDALRKQAEDSKMRGFERITAIAFDNEPFSIENGLLTPSLKPQIHSLKKKYAEKVAQLYEADPAIAGLN